MFTAAWVAAAIVIERALNSRTDSGGVPISALAGAPRPLIESLAIMLLEILAALFHFDEHDRFPDVIGKGCPSAVFIGLADAEPRYSSAANNSSSRTVAKLVAESLIAYGMMSSRPCNKAPQVYTTFGT
jgi:hypothetical protein